MDADAEFAYLHSLDKATKPDSSTDFGNGTGQRFYSERTDKNVMTRLWLVHFDEAGRVTDFSDTTYNQ